MRHEARAMRTGKDNTENQVHQTMNQIYTRRVTSSNHRDWVVENDD